jgi:hypothetical protein
MPLDRERLFRNFIRRLSEKPYMGEEDVIAYERTFHKFLEDRYVTDEFLNSEEFKSSIEDILSSRSKETFWEKFFDKLIDKLVELHGLTWSPSPDRARRGSRSSPRGSPGRARSRSRSPPRGSPARARSRSRSPPRGSPGRARSRSRSPPRGSPARARSRIRSPPRGSPGRARENTGFTRLPSTMHTLPGWNPFDELLDEDETREPLSPSVLRPTAIRPVAVERVHERHTILPSSKYRINLDYKEIEELNKLKKKIKDKWISKLNIINGEYRGSIEGFKIIMNEIETLIDRVLNNKNFNKKFISSDLFKLYYNYIPNTKYSKKFFKLIDFLTNDLETLAILTNYSQFSKKKDNYLQQIILNEFKNINRYSQCGSMLYSGANEICFYEPPLLREFWINKISSIPNINSPDFLRQIIPFFKGKDFLPGWEYSAQKIFNFILGKAREFNSIPPAV